MEGDKMPTPRPATHHPMPTERQGVTHKFEVGAHKGYLNIGYYEDGKPGEIFIHIAKEGSTISGFVEALAISISIGLQHGVPLEKYCEKFENVRFEPMGRTSNRDIPEAKSIVDYVFRWLKLRFLS